MRRLKATLRTCALLALTTGTTSCMDMMMGHGAGDAAGEKLRSSLLGMRARADQHHERVIAASDQAVIAGETDSYVRDMASRMSEMMAACESMMFHCMGDTETVGRSDPEALSIFMSAAFREHASAIRDRTTADEMKALAREHRRHVHAMLGHMEMMDRMMAMHR
jgi:hypothetical protein